MQDMIHELDLKLAAMDDFKIHAKQFLFDTNLLKDRSLTRTTSNPQLKAMETEEPILFHSHHRHSMYDDPIDTQDTFDSRIQSTVFLIHSLTEELKEFKQSLNQTELLIHDVQLDMDDFRHRMEVYMKDIPESHFSALKQLELDIESILSKRAKNPWMDTGYALLSYLLTLFALGVWIVIYMIKLGKKILLFPFKLWKDYSDYLVERNKAVKKASMRSVSTTRHTSQTNLMHRQQERASSSSSFVTAYDDHLFPTRPSSKKQ
ncbi:hypothetical protein BD560DRAFT_409567 [Blakeslea trispora]|nr:hypothetical protein BD560DRAFT_409567 [Blakeslea trispora]